MKSRKEIILQICLFLNENITDQFDINEVDAALDGNTVFYLGNTRGDKVKVQSFSCGDNSVYEILNYWLFVDNSKI